MNTKYAMLMSSKILYSYLWIRDINAFRNDIVIFDFFFLSVFNNFKFTSFI